MERQLENHMTSGTAWIHQSRSNRFPLVAFVAARDSYANSYLYGHVSFVRAHGLPPVPGDILDSFGFVGPSMAFFGVRGFGNDRKP